MMKKLIFLLLFSVSSFVFSSLTTYDSNIKTHVNCVKAEMDHLSLILKLTDEIPLKSLDCQKIIILPKQFQLQAFTNDIVDGKLFVALANNVDCVGYKKFFLISQEKLFNMLAKEIRCIGNKCEFVDFYSLRQEHTAIIRRRTDLENPLNNNFFNNHPTFYIGADYIKPEFRRKGICKELYEASLSHVFNMHKQLFVKNGYVCVVYGLSQSNDYDSNGAGESRTQRIAQEVFKSLSVYATIYTIFITRYKAYMPQFDDSGNILSDEQSVPGYGNCLLFGLGDLKKV